MSLATNETVIKRFTYDWLIRFAELHPFNVSNFNSNHRLYNPQTSKYAKISPMLTALVTRHVPNIIYITEVNDILIGNSVLSIKKCLFEREIDLGPYISSFNLVASKKPTVFISDAFVLVDFVPGIITSLINARHVLYSESFNFLYHTDRAANNITPTITSEELKYLLNFGNFKNNVVIDATLTEPITFSKIWPNLAHCETVCLNIKNLIYDDNMANVIRKNICPKFIVLEEFDVSDKALLEMFDVFLLRPVRRCLRLFFKQHKEIALAEAIIDKYKFPGGPKHNLNNVGAMFNYLEIDSEGVFRFCN